LTRVSIAQPRFFGKNLPETFFIGRQEMTKWIENILTKPNANDTGGF